MTIDEKNGFFIVFFRFSKNRYKTVFFQYDLKVAFFYDRSFLIVKVYDFSMTCYNYSFFMTKNKSDLFIILNGTMNSLSKLFMMW